MEGSRVRLAASQVIERSDQEIPPHRHCAIDTFSEGCLPRSQGDHEDGYWPSSLTAATAFAILLVYASR